MAQLIYVCYNFIEVSYRQCKYIIQIIIALTAVFTAWLKWEEHRRREEEHKSNYSRRRSYSSDSSHSKFSSSPAKNLLFWIVWFIFGLPLLYFLWFSILVNILNSSGLTDSLITIIMVLALISFGVSGIWIVRNLD